MLSARWTCQWSFVTTGFNQFPTIDFTQEQQILRITAIPSLLLANRLNGYRREIHKIHYVVRSVGLHYVRVNEPPTSIADVHYKVVLWSLTAVIKSPILLLSKYKIYALQLAGTCG